MTHEWHERFGLDAAHAHALMEFARAYLHEDVLAEYGSALKAAGAFAGVSSLNERAQVALSLDIIGLANHSPSRLTRLFTRHLRCAWMPSSSAELHALAEEIRHHSGIR